jgi:aminopeptidase N
VAGRTYHDQWISEGFAQYFAWMYTTSVDGPVAGQRLMARMRSSTEGLEAEGPIRLGYRLGHLRGDRRIHRSIAYNKSAVVLHMLRRLIGDDAFVSGLGRLYATHRFSTVDVEDVRDAFQQGTPLPLDRFFTRWIRESAVPRLRTSWRHIPSGGVVIVIEQVGPLFDLPYDVTVRYADGREETTTLAITAPAAEIELPARGPVRRVEFDDPLTIARIVR